MIGSVCPEGKETITAATGNTAAAVMASHRRAGTEPTVESQLLRLGVHSETAAR
jgi:hypothetical protein